MEVLFRIILAIGSQLSLARVASLLASRQSFMLLYMVFVRRKRMVSDTLYVKSNSKLVLHLTQHTCQWVSIHPYSPLIQIIYKLIDLEWTVNFKHTLWEGNTYADWFTKYGAMHGETFLSWHVCPTQLGPLVLTHRMGVVHIRL